MKKLFSPLVMVGLLTVVSGAAEGADQAARADWSPFGIGSSSSSSGNHEKWIPQMAKIGIHILRDPGGTAWEGTQRASWDELDKNLAYLASQDFTSGATLYSSRSGQSGFPLDDLPGWSEGVADIVGHAKGKIRYWEVWNEPPNGTPDSPGSDYAKLMLATYAPAKQANPDCLVGMAAKSVDVNYLDQAITAGAKDNFDYITLHPYETVGCMMDFPGAEAVFMNIVPTVRKMLEARDPSKINVPVIFTEVGYDATKGADRQAHALIKVYTMGIAQGVACIQWFEGMDGDSGPMGLLEADGTPRPAYTAMAQMIRLLGEHPAYLGWVMINDKDYGFVFQGAKHAVLVAWAPKGTSDVVDFGQLVFLIDPLTGNGNRTSTYSLTEAPIMVDGVPSKLVEQARADKFKPFPWGGDYTDAKSISVTFGKTNVEKGLHTQSSVNIAADVVLYGGSARAGRVPGGNVFMVDPNFLTYTSTPIAVSVVVRRNPADDNAGFALKYESAKGTNNCGWYTVPEGKDWTTMTWKINDEQFVSMYGFNFALDSDGDQYNTYEIKSVTVTKLKN
jgi:hypothetical protein